MMAGGTGKRRVVLLFTVLAGLFLMHGLSAPAMHGMPMPMPTPTSMPVSVHADSAMSVAVSAAMPSHDNAPSAQSGPDPMSAHMQADMTCVPLRPGGMSSLFLALFLIVVALWRPRLSLPACLIHPHWPHGPPRTGVQVLRTLSISRT